MIDFEELEQIDKSFNPIVKIVKMVGEKIRLRLKFKHKKISFFMNDWEYYNRLQSAL